MPFVRSYACLNILFKTTLTSDYPVNCELQATISFLMQKKNMKFVNIYWPFSEDDGEKTMSPRVTRTP